MTIGARFRWTSLIAGMALSALLGADRGRRPLPEFGVIFNDDADLAFVVPDRARSEALLRANIAALADTPVKTFVFCVGMGGDLLYYNTRVASRVGWRKSPDETPGSLMEKRMENARTCLAQGADAVRTAGEAARAVGLRFIPSLRMNDAHFMANPDQHAMTSEFWFQHRDRLTIRESPLPFQPAYGNLLDFTHPEVRQLRLDTVVEVLERNRDLVDGFELDFNRFQVFFPRGRAAAGAPFLTQLVRDVRERLRRLEGEVGRPLYLFVRIPPSLEDCRTAGLEVDRWMAEGLVDLVSPAQIMTLAGDMPLSELSEIGRREGVAVYPSLYPRTSWRVPFPAPGSSRYAAAKVTRDATTEEIRGAAASYWSQGVGGFYLFNFYNGFGNERPHRGQLYQVLRDVARPENLRGQPLVYAVTKSYYFDGPGSYAYGKQLPAKVGADGALKLTLPLGETRDGDPFPLRGCELRLGFRALPPGSRVSVQINGRDLPTEGSRVVSVATREITGGAVRARDAAETYLHLPIDHTEWLVKGVNRFELSVRAASPATEVTDLEVRLDFENDYDRLWQRVPVELNGR